MNNSELIKFKPVTLGNNLIECFRVFDIGATYLLQTSTGSHYRWRVGKFRMDFATSSFGFIEDSGDFWKLRYDSDLESISCAFIIDETLASIKHSEGLPNVKYR